MKASEIEANLHKWAGEFSTIVEKPVNVPHQLWKYISVRIADLGEISHDDDVVRADVAGGWRRVRIVGTRVGGMIQYELADGRGAGVFPMRSVHSDDRGKLSEILEKLVVDGKVKESEFE